MSRFGITLPMLNTPLRRIPQLVRWAEEAGFDSVFSYEFFRSPYMGLANAALQTNNIKLATGVAVAFSRTPFVTANAAADIDELSQGRMILGLGTGSPEFLSAFHDSDLSSAVARMREYVEAVRVSWNYLSSGKPGIYQGKFYRLTFPEFMPFGRRPLVRDRIPIYLAGIRPKMIQLAGEVADGLLGAFFSVKYLKEVVHPNVALGARRAGRDPATIDIAAEIVCSVSKDRSEAMRRAHIQAGMYAAHPAMDEIIRVNGLEKERNAVREALLREGPGVLERATDEKLVEILTVSGTPDECRRKLQIYEEVLPLVVFHAPYVPPLSAEETEDAFRSIVETFSK